MKVAIDTSTCTGHGRCYVVAADVFGCDDDGNGVVKLDRVPSELEAQARRAEQSCPERAIVLAAGD